MNTTEVNLHQALMNEFYEYWQQNEEERENALSRFSPKHQAAVRLGNLNYQVGNGGFSQWEVNGFSVDANKIVLLCDLGISLGLNSFSGLKAIMYKYLNIPLDDTITTIEECTECQGIGYIGEESDDEECGNCSGTGEIDVETDNSNEQDMIYKEISLLYFELESLFDDMNTLLLRWDQFDSTSAKEIGINDKHTLKPICDMREIDGNVFNIIAHVNRTLEGANQHEEVKEFKVKAKEQKSYEAVLALITDYVKIKR